MICTFAQIHLVVVSRRPQPFNAPSLREIPVHHRDDLSKVWVHFVSSSLLLSELLQPCQFETQPRNVHGPIAS